MRYEPQKVSTPIVENRGYEPTRAEPLRVEPNRISEPSRPTYSQ